MGTTNTEESFSLAPPAAFLTKTFNFVSDPETNHAVEWMPSGRSFLVKQTDIMEREILPLYFKHANFSSFVRQLNTYGFKKMDPDHWEFANEYFQRDCPDLLGQIGRKRKQAAAKAAARNPAIEVGKFGDLESEVDSLKRDKKHLAKEVVRMRQQQQLLEHKLQHVQHNFQQVHQRTLENEKQTKAMFRFVSKALHNPTFLNQIMQFQTGHGSNEYLTHHATTNGRKKRRTCDEPEDGANSDGALVPYQQPSDDLSLAHMMRNGDQAGPSYMIDNPGAGGGLTDMDSAFQGMGFDDDISQAPPNMGIKMPAIPHLAYGEEEYGNRGQPAHQSGHTFVEVSTPTSPSDEADFPNNNMGSVQDWAGEAQDAALLNEMGMNKGDAEALDKAEDWLQYLNVSDSDDFLPQIPSDIASNQQYGKLSS